MRIKNRNCLPWQPHCRVSLVRQSHRPISVRLAFGVRWPATNLCAPSISAFCALVRISWCCRLPRHRSRESSSQMAYHFCKNRGFFILLVCLLGLSLALAAPPISTPLIAGDNLWGICVEMLGCLDGSHICDDSWLNRSASHQTRRPAEWQDWGCGGWLSLSFDC